MTGSSSSQPARDRPMRRCIMVCQHRSCQRSGAKAALDAFRAADLPRGTLVAESGCMGLCSAGPNVQITPDQVFYCRVTPDRVDRIVSDHLEQGQPVTEFLHSRLHQQYDLDSFQS